MELIPILTRAESLFHRFERAVQAIDKKNNFPAPAAHQRKPTQDSSASTNSKGKSPQRPQSTAFSSGVSAGPSSAPDSEGETKVVSPELRELFHKDIPWARKSPSKQKQQQQQEEPAKGESS